MLRYVLRRILMTIPTILIASAIVFLMLRFIPGDPAMLMAGEDPKPEVIQALRRQWGLEEPLPVQYLMFIRNIVEGNLGISIRSGLPVLYEISLRLPHTMILSLVAMVLSTALGILVGIVSSTRPYSLVDNVSMFFALLGVSAPAFWTGLMLMWVFAVRLGWLPAVGVGTPAHLVLPSIALTGFTTPVLARQTRSSMLEVLRQDYIRTARSKGLSERAIVYGHAVRNALIPVITVAGISFGRLLGGSIVTETVFAYPGIGKMLIDGIFARDYPMIQGAVLVYALIFMFLNLLVDMMYAYVDPRIHYE
jgi:ABC-type dipeptide/oligopeptide/nickel transport system permease component